MIQMSLDMRRIMMYVALCFYLQANIVYVLKLINIAICFLFFFFLKDKIWSTNKTSA